MKRNQPTVARSAALMSVATLASRITGLARVFVMAAAVGTTYVSSAYEIANTVPNMIYELAIGGLLNAAFVPLYLLQMEKYGREGGNRYASNLLNIVVLVMGTLTLFATFFAPQVIATQTFTQPVDAEVTTTAIYFFRIFAVQLLLYGIGGVVTALLNANRVFVLPSVAPAFNNLLVIGSFIAYMLLVPTNSQLALLILAVGTTAGVFMQVAVQVPALIKQGFRWTPRIDFRDPGFIDTLKTGVPMIIYLVGMTAAFTFRNNFSLYADPTSGKAILSYAWIWFQLPHGVIAVSLSRALFTEMSKSAAAEDMGAFRRFMQLGNTGTLLCIIPLAGLMSLLSEQIMQMFQMRAFTADDVAVVGLVLSVWVAALPFYSFQLHLFNVYASLRRFMTFSLICTGFCALQCALYAALSSPDLLGLLGICLADIAYYAITVVILLAVLRRYVGEVGIRGTLTSGLKALAASLVVLVLLWLALPHLPHWSGPLGGFAMTVLYGSVGLAAILALYKLFRIQEMDLLAKAAKRIVKRS
ncbi:MAG: murein biosynthesis integral membrane protein MurJ [Coriobacteriia bacterium]|nr:murein biosynthesis integral membrane protein MurJ [Coriobacteriia bacterium]